MLMRKSKRIASARGNGFQQMPIPSGERREKAVRACPLDERKRNPFDAESPVVTTSNFVPTLLKPRFTYPIAISFLSLRAALVIQPTSFPPGVEGGTSFIPA